MPNSNILHVKAILASHRSASLRRDQADYSDSVATSLWVTLRELLAGSWLEMSPDCGLHFGEYADNWSDLAPARAVHHQSQTQYAAKDERTSRLSEDGRKSATPLAR